MLRPKASLMWVGVTAGRRTAAGAGQYHQKREAVPKVRRLWSPPSLPLSKATGPFWKRLKAPGGFPSRWQASSALPLTQRTLQPAAESGLQLGSQAAVRGPGATALASLPFGPGWRSRAAAESEPQRVGPGRLAFFPSSAGGGATSKAFRSEAPTHGLEAGGGACGPQPQFPRSPARRLEGG